MEYFFKFEEAARKQRFQEAEKEAKKRKREIAQAEKRIAELDRIFKRTYEDDISGTISHERFLKLSADYEAEQKELLSKIAESEVKLQEMSKAGVDFKVLLKTLREFTDIKKLTPTEQQVVNLRFVKGKSQAEVGKILGVSQMFVSRAERKIVEKLREALIK